MRKWSPEWPGRDWNPRHRFPATDQGCAHVHAALDISAGGSGFQRDLKLLTFGGLTAQQERLRVCPFATDLERYEVLVPGPLWSIGFRFSPQLQMVKIICRDLALAEPVEQVVAERGRQTRPLDPRHLLTERHASQIRLDTLMFLRIAGMREAVGQVEETLPFLLSSLEASLDEIDNDTIGARVARLHERSHASGDTGGEADALTDRLLDGWHCTMLHHYASSTVRADANFHCAQRSPTGLKPEA